MKEIYVIGFFIDGQFSKYVRKGRNDSISAYDNLASAKRGLSQTRSTRSKYKENYKLINFNNGQVVEV